MMRDLAFGPMLGAVLGLLLASAGIGMGVSVFPRGALGLGAIVLSGSVVGTLAAYATSRLVHASRAGSFVVASAIASAFTAFALRHDLTQWIGASQLGAGAAPAGSLGLIVLPCCGCIGGLVALRAPRHGASRP